MIALKKYQNKRIAIYGMGKTGFSAADTFKKLKAHVFCWDDSEKIRKKIKKLNYPLNRFWLKQNDLYKIVLSPGIDINNCKIKKFLKENSKKIITDLDLFFELNKDALIISITGTNGKSTTCKMIEKILKTAKYDVKTVGNIGNPILSNKKTNKKFIFIIEVSSYQLQYSKIFRSKHAAILNISPDHLERHKNMENYIRAKAKIFFAQKKSDHTYINSSNKYSDKIKKIFKEKNLNSKLTLINKSDSNFILKKINNKFLQSKGNIENLSFAFKIAKNLKVENKVIIKAMKEFKGLPHRQEIVLSRKNILCINDSKATSFDACLQSLTNFNNIYWIVGGLPKYQDNFYLQKVKNKIIKAYIVGKNISFFKKQIKNKIPYKVSNNIKNAVNDIFKDLKFNDCSNNIVLLSPAAASFDQFDNFENRGLYFKNIIKEKFK